MRRTADSYDWEADQRHAELIITGMGLLLESKPLSSLGRKLTAKEREEDDEEELAPDHLQLEPTSWQEIGPTLPSL